MSSAKLSETCLFHASLGALASAGVHRGSKTWTAFGIEKRSVTRRSFSATLKPFCFLSSFSSSTAHFLRTLTKTISRICASFILSGRDSSFASFTFSRGNPTVGTPQWSAHIPALNNNNTIFVYTAGSTTFTVTDQLLKTIWSGMTNITSFPVRVFFGEFYHFCFERHNHGSQCLRCHITPLNLFIGLKCIHRTQWTLIM